MSLGRILCFFGLHAWKVEHDGEVPGARVHQRYCPRCGTEQVTYEVYDFFEWETWIRELTDNHLEEGMKA